MTQPLVSILIPAYNAEQWIAQTLDSALAQTYPHTEIIVVDDGSTDGTLEIARRYASPGPEPTVRVVTQANAGAAAARNHAYRLSRGQWIQWLDADDLLSPDKIAAQFAVAGDPLEMLSCKWGRFYYCTDRAVFSPSPLWANLRPSDWLRLKMGQNQFMQPATWLVSRQLTELAGPWDESLTLDDDGPYFLDLLTHSHGVRFVEGPCVYYRASGRLSLSHFAEEKLASQFTAIQRHITALRSYADDDETTEACVAYLHAWSRDFASSPYWLAQLHALCSSQFTADLRLPRLSWKYRWLDAVSPSLARTAQRALPLLKSEVRRSLDHLRYRRQIAR
jgi:hypothetical protein